MALHSPWAPLPNHPERIRSFCFLNGRGDKTTTTTAAATTSQASKRKMNDSLGCDRFKCHDPEPGIQTLKCVSVCACVFMYDKGRLSCGQLWHYFSSEKKKRRTAATTCKSCIFSSLLSSFFHSRLYHYWNVTRKNTLCEFVKDENEAEEKSEQRNFGIGSS